MALPFFIAGQSILGQTPKQDYTSLFQETINLQFSNASDVYTIQEETALASGAYQNVDVRVNGLINPTTGDTIEDDYKKLLFKDIGHSVDLGRMYQFDNNYWITINVDKVKSLVQTAVVKRCNNALRWIGTDGGYYEVPCSLGYLLIENRDYATAGSAVVVPSGMEQCIVQFNSATNTIQPNQRFLLGNPGHFTAFRVEGGGINNFNNLSTMTNTSPGFMRLTLNVDFAGAQTGTDNLTLGIANYYENVYTVTINQTAISGDISQTVQLSAIVELNGEVVTRQLVWESDDILIATVSSTGLVTFVDEGTATITATLLNNNTIFDTCGVTVGATPVDDYQVIYSPTTNYVLEDLTKTWTVYLYKNGIQQADTFVFTLDANTVPITNYIYTVLSGNTFSVRNIERFLTDTLEITATSGIYSRVIPVDLRGAW